MSLVSEPLADQMRLSSIGVTAAYISDVTTWFLPEFFAW